MFRSLIPLLATVAVLPAGQQQLVAVRSAGVATSDALSATIVIEASGPLPEPLVGVLDGPPRVYLDFPGVARRTRGSAGDADGVVLRVRVGDFQADPIITRVVIDLAEPLPHRVDASQREQGRITVFLNRTATPRVPRRAARDVVAAAVERDTASLRNALAQLEKLRPVLSAIDARLDMPEPSLRAALDEFNGIRLSLDSLRAGTAREDLVKVCMLGVAAVTTRLEAPENTDPSRAWNAASAAAGALITLDRARANLKTGEKPRL